MPFSHTSLDILFLLSVSITWAMILYQLFLTIAGNRYRYDIQKTEKELEQIPVNPKPVSIMIPAHNEELVIEKTIERIQSLDYPPEMLQVVVINDASQDNTAALVEALAEKDKRIKLVTLEGDRGHGKAYALNIGLEHCSHDLITIYDADNNPSKDSLKILVSHLSQDDGLAAVIGKFRTINRAKNSLTRFINIETMAFQWILQAGRYKTSRIAILPGTNYVVRKSVIKECGGWDPKAITEDSEISVRIYRLGYKIKFVPTSVTWEQEPEKISTWIRQRTRWVRGNNYVLQKFAPDTFKFKSRFLLIEFFYLFALYYLFLAAIVISHMLFLLSAIGVVALNVPGPYFGVWVSAYILFVLEIVVVLSYEHEDSGINLLYTLLMYFTYCQLWLYVVFKALSLDFRRHKVGEWDKTERFEVNVPSEQEA